MQTTDSTLSPAGDELYKISASLFSHEAISNLPQTEQKIIDFLKNFFPEFNIRDHEFLQSLKNRLKFLQSGNSSLLDLMNRICESTGQLHKDLLFELPLEIISHHILASPPHKNAIMFAKVNHYYRSLFQRKEFANLFAYNRLINDGLSRISSTLLRANDDIYVYILEGSPLLLASNFKSRNPQNRCVNQVRGFILDGQPGHLSFISEYLGLRYGPFRCTLDGNSLLDSRQRINLDEDIWNEMNAISLQQQLLNLGFLEFEFSEYHYFIKIIQGNDLEPPKVFLVICHSNIVINILTTFHATKHGEIIKAILSKNQLPSFIFEDQNHRKTIVQFKKVENNIVGYLTVNCVSSLV